MPKTMYVQGKAVVTIHDCTLPVSDENGDDTTMAKYVEDVLRFTLDYDAVTYRYSVEFKEEE